MEKTAADPLALPGSKRANPVRIFTIGHSNHPVERFAQLLRSAGVTALADVRSQPFSQRYPDYNRPELEAFLREMEIAYAFLGDQLGGRPRQMSLYHSDGRVDYERVRAASFFRQGIDRLVRAVEDYRVVLLCAEEDPIDCHRGLMVAPALVEQGLPPSHLRGDGSVETMAAMEERLLTETGVGQGVLDGLFAPLLSEEERKLILAEAYRAQARLRAFRLRPNSTEDSLNREDP